MERKTRSAILFFGSRMVPDVRCELQPHQGALCCIVSVGLLLFLNRKTEKQKRELSTNGNRPHRSNGWSARMANREILVRITGKRVEV